MRLIDADALIGELHNYRFYEGDDRTIVYAVIEKQPTIEPQKWISCDERLPEEETDVLVTRTFLGCKDGSRGWNAHIPPSTYVEVAQYFNGEWTALSDEYKVARNRHTDPIAWQPLPEPWRGDNNAD